MLAHELRVGNYVNRRFTDGSIKIEIINGYDFWHAEQLNNVCHLVEWNSISPIPITKEWIDRLPLTDSTQLLLYVPDANNYLGIYLYFEKTNNDEYCCHLSNLFGNISQKMIYIHQVQNLYFALTGKELEIKL